LKVTERTTAERRLAGSFFFSRKHTQRRTTGYFFATLAYQLATNFPSIRADMDRAIRENPALLDPDKSLHDQMEALFLHPLRQLYFRLRDSPSPVFVIDALDECASETEVVDLISLLGQALHEPDVPVIHILLTSRSEAHIHDAIQEEGVRPLVCEIPVKTYGEGVLKIISLDGVDVDYDIYVFLKQSFKEFRSHCSNFPQPTALELAQLASRAGRRFIVASTMMKFIHDGYNDPSDQVQLMLELTSELLPGTELYKLYDSILSTCTNPTRAYLHLSVVAALADPLPMSQISELLGPGQGRDVETALIQLRSVMDIPTDSSLPVNIYHSSVRDYVSNPSNCSLPQVQHGLTSPHSLLARSSLRLMIRAIPTNTTLLDALLELNQQSQAIHGIQADDPQRLKYSLSFIVQPPESLQVLIRLIWLRGVRSPGLQHWLGDQDGRSWLQTQEGKRWLGTQEAQDWLKTPVGETWLQTWMGKAWLQTQSGCQWLRSSQGWLWTQRWPTVAKDLIQHEWLGELETQRGDQPEAPPLPTVAKEHEWLGELETQRGDQLETPSLLTLQRQNWVWTLHKQRKWLHTLNVRWLPTPNGREWLQTPDGREWLQTLAAREWLQTRDAREWLQTRVAREWLQTRDGREWLQTRAAREWLQTRDAGREWLQTPDGREWLHTPDGREWLHTPDAREWLHTPDGREWLQTPDGREWLQTPDAREWLQTPDGREWLHTPDAREWLQTRNGREWLQTRNGREWVQTPNGREWLQTPNGREWLQTRNGREWVQTWNGREWLQTPDGREWLQTRHGREWLHTRNGREWLQTPDAREWLQTPDPREWLQTPDAREWLQTRNGREWLQTRNGQEWLQTPDGQEWLQTPDGQEWLQTPDGREWLQTLDGREWLQTRNGREWVQTRNGQECVQTRNGQEWLQTQNGKEWLKTRSGLEWLKTLSGLEWLKTQSGLDWLLTEGGQKWVETLNGQYWLQTQSGLDWLQTECVQKWLQLPSAHKWLQTLSGQEWLRTQSGRNWLQTPGVQKWLQTPSGRQWLRARDGRRWLQTPGGQKWLQTSGGEEWLKIEGGEGWLQTKDGKDWLIQNGQDWLQTSGGRDWLQTRSGRDWLHTWDARDWLQTQGGQDWLQIVDIRYLFRTQSWEDWLQSPGGRDWLQSLSGRDWMQTPDGQAWQLTSVASIWVTMEDFSSTLEAINRCTIIQESPAFQVIQHFESLPDFLMFPAFLALMHRSGPTSASLHDRILPDVDIIHAMMAFRIFADEAQERSRSASDALKYACQNFTMHLSQVQEPWDNILQHIFKSFWNDHLVSWLEMLWCLKGLRSCLVILSEGQKLAKVCSISDDFRDSTPDLLLGTSPSPSLTVTAVGGLKLSNVCKTATTRRSLSFTDEEIFVTRYYACRSLDERHKSVLSKLC
jgi:hypothetical protein